MHVATLAGPEALPLLVIAVAVAVALAVAVVGVR
jgi:hypothetical protein